MVLFPICVSSFTIASKEAAHQLIFLKSLCILENGLLKDKAKAAGLHIH